MLASLRDRIVGSVVSVLATGKTQAELALAVTVAAQGRNVILLAPTGKTKKNALDVAHGELGLTAEQVTDYERARAEVRYRSYDDGSPGRVYVSMAEVLLNDAEALASARVRPAVSFLDSVGALVSDESQFWSRDTWNRLLLHLPNLSRSHGFTATGITPREEKASNFLSWRWKNAHALAGCGPVAFRSTLREARVGELVNRPTLVSYRYRWGEVAALEDEDRDQSWLVTKPFLYGNGRRNRTIVALLRLFQEVGRITLVPVAETERIRSLVDLLDSPRAMYWLGDDKAYGHDHRPLRTADLEGRIAAGEFDVVFATSHINVGWSLPALNTMLMTEGRETGDTIQRSGRIIRLSPTRSVLVNMLDDSYNFFRQSERRRIDLERYYGTKAVTVENPAELRRLL
jgi:superfamily II DNA or RNA helicase